MASGLDLQCAEVSYLPIPPCAKAIPTAALPWEKPMYSVCGSQAVYSHNKHNTTASVACFESFVSPRTWLMLSTQLPPIHGAAVGARQMYSHRLSVLISFLHAHATLTRLQLHHLARVPRPGVPWRLWVFAQCTTSRILHGGFCTNLYQPA